MPTKRTLLPLAIAGCIGLAPGAAISDDGLAAFHRTWIGPATFCSNRLLPMSGLVAVIQPGNASDALWFTTDEILAGERLGVEGLGCQFENLRPVHPGVYSGQYACGGEGFSEAFMGFPAIGDLLISTDQYGMEVEIRRGTHVERWGTCQG